MEQNLKRWKWQEALLENLHVGVCGLIILEMSGIGLCGSVGFKVSRKMLKLTSQRE